MNSFSINFGAYVERLNLVTLSRSFGALGIPIVNVVELKEIKNPPTICISDEKENIQDEIECKHHAVSLTKAD